jgi:hypothetical protein
LGGKLEITIERLYVSGSFLEVFWHPYRPLTNGDRKMLYMFSKSLHGFLNITYFHPFSPTFRLFLFTRNAEAKNQQSQTKESKTTIHDPIRLIP